MPARKLERCQGHREVWDWKKIQGVGFFRNWPQHVIQYPYYSAMMQTINRGKKTPFISQAVGGGIEVETSPSRKK